MENKVIVQDSTHKRFALKCIEYFSARPEWTNISRYIVNLNSQNIKLTDNKSFALTGMFFQGNIDDINERNSRGKDRWFTEPFKFQNRELYLSVDWYPENSEKRNYQLTIVGLAKFIQECFGPQYVVSKTQDGKSWILSISTDSHNPIPSTVMEPNNPNAFSISKIISHIAETGLLYSPQLVKRVAFSLMTKRFLILSGLAGSGKTQLAIAFADSLIEDDSQKRVVAVGADWTNREPLLGFPNALQKGEYVKPETGVLDLLIDASRPENENKPYFLILDEMNMSYVERYFADFLSAMESEQKIPLWKPEENEGDEKEDMVPESVRLPDNLFIIGTINVDETTYMFSPKVLDRANVIEFKISPDEMTQFLANMKPVKRNLVKGKAKKMAEEFVSISKNKDLGDSPLATQQLGEFFKILKDVNAEFGYRTATEIYRFISHAQHHDDTSSKMTDAEILDCVVVQKLLPKLHGSRKKLNGVLKALWSTCFAEELDKETNVFETDKEARFPLTADKVKRMYRAAEANGFASFAEA